MQAKLFRSLVLLLLLNGLIKPFWLLFIDRKVQTILGAEEYGLYFALFSLSLQLGMLLDPGLHTWNVRGLGGKTHGINDALRPLFRIKMGLGLAYCLLTLGLGLALGYDVRAMQWLLGLVALQWLSSMVLWLRSFLSGMQVFGADSIASVTDRALVILLSVPFLYGAWSGWLSIPLFILLQCLSLGLAAIGLFFYLARNLDKSAPVAEGFQWRRVLRQSAPIAILTLLMTAYTRLDAVFIERISGPKEAGVFAAAYRLFDAANIIAYLIGSTLVAAFSRAALDPENHRTLLRSAAGLMAAIAVPVMTVGMMAADPLMNLLYSGEAAFRWEVLFLLMAAYPGIAMMYLFGSALTALGKFRFLNTVSLSILFLSAGLLIWLLPGDGDFRGATIGAMVACAAQWCVGISYLFYAWIKWGGPWLAWLLGKTLLLAAAIVSLQIALRNLDLSWVAVAISGLLGGLIFALLLGLVNFRPMLQALRAKVHPPNEHH